MLTDRTAQWKRGRYFLPAHMFAGGATHPDHNITQVTGRPLQGLLWDGSLNGLTTGGKYEGHLIVPQHWDPHWPLGITPIWCTDQGTANDGVTWLTLLAVKQLNTALAAAAAGALDTVHGAQVIASAATFLVMRGNRGIKNGDWSTAALIHTPGIRLEFSVEMDAVAQINMGANEQVWLLGLEFDYVPMLTRAPHMDIDAPLDDQFR